MRMGSTVVAISLQLEATTHVARSDCMDNHASDGSLQLKIPYNSLPLHTPHGTGSRAEQDDKTRRVKTARGSKGNAKAATGYLDTLIVKILP
jgi:hypothetical protein